MVKRSSIKLKQRFVVTMNSLINPLWFLLYWMLFSFHLAAIAPYAFFDEPIDVVIPCIRKDMDTLEMCIEGIRANGQNIGRIIVVSDEKLTDKAEWFDEKKFPFNQKDISLALFKGSLQGIAYLSTPGSRVGWYYQQLLKLYAPLTIPDISSNVLVLDADTIFLNPVSFIHPISGGGLYNPGSEYHLGYFYHAARLSGNQIYRLNPDYSGITHHMLFQRAVIVELLHEIENYHQQPFWKAFGECVDLNELFVGASEYEIYFNYVFSKTPQVFLRPLKWANIQKLKEIPQYKDQGYHFVSCHDWCRIED